MIDGTAKAAERALPLEQSANHWCQERRGRFAQQLADRGFDCAILTRPLHLAYFFGLSGWRSDIAAGYIRADGSNLLSVGASADCDCFADSVVRFEDARYSTLMDDRESLALQALPKWLGAGDRTASDAPTESTDRSVTHLITQLRRRKDPDEVSALVQAIEATEAGYRAVKPVIGAGVLETEIFGVFHAAASVAAGEGLGALGNDFRGGHPGGRPRPVPLVAGDLLPIDAGVTLRNYNADLCRTFAVTGSRNAFQDRAFGCVEEALLMAEGLVRPGVSCRSVFEEVSNWLNGRGLGRFDHHLGHGIGLAAHEAPRINPRWDDWFEEGDTFTLEPGLYADDLHAGVRLEQNYVIDNGNLRRLSTIAIDL